MAEGNEHSSRRLRRGLPAEPLLERRLAFDPGSQKLVLSGVAKRRGALPQLYYRGIGELTYRSVTDLLAVPSDSEKCELMTNAWVLAPNSVLFCVVSEVGDRGLEQTRPVSHRCLLRLDLQQLQCTTWEDRHGELEGLMIAELTGTSASGDELFGVMGLRPAGGGAVSYHLTSMSWPTGAISTVAPLDDIFF